MAKSRPNTAVGFVLEKLYNTQDELEATKAEVSALKAELDDFKQAFKDIREVFRVTLTSTGTEFKITITCCCHYYVMCFSGSLDPEKFSEDFIQLVKLLRLEIPTIAATPNNSTETKAED